MNAPPRCSPINMRPGTIFASAVLAAICLHTLAMLLAANVPRPALVTCTMSCWQCIGCVRDVFGQHTHIVTGGARADSIIPDDATTLWVNVTDDDVADVALRSWDAVAPEHMRIVFAYDGLWWEWVRHSDHVLLWEQKASAPTPSPTPPPSTSTCQLQPAWRTASLNCTDAVVGPSWRVWFDGDDDVHIDCPTMHTDAHCNDWTLSLDASRLQPMSTDDERLAWRSMRYSPLTASSSWAGVVMNESSVWRLSDTRFFVAVLDLA
jgi:hypothetical protein